MQREKSQILTHFLSKLWNKWQVELKSFKKSETNILYTRIESLEEARANQLSGFFSFALELLYG